MVIKNLVGCLCALLLVSGCTQDKEYSVKEVVKAWNDEGANAPLVAEVREACAKHEDKGEKGSAVCDVLHQAQAEVASKSLDSGANGGIHF
jgi:hypothetical protein